MGHSIRSKRKRAFRAVKRERYALKERACLDKLLEKSNLKQYVEQFQNTREEPIEDTQPQRPQGKILTH
jgi:TfoX/Sxy family transcriptional regulator of competence genes